MFQVYNLHLFCVLNSTSSFLSSSRRGSGGGGGASLSRCSSPLALLSSAAAAAAASRSRRSFSLAALSCASSSLTCSCASLCARLEISAFARSVSATPRSLPTWNLVKRERFHFLLSWKWCCWLMMIEIYRDTTTRSNIKCNDKLIR